MAVCIIGMRVSDRYPNPRATSDKVDAAGDEARGLFGDCD